MKINKMILTEYGCMDYKEIEFGENISIIKGNNESGKSTTHQAMLDLMFGFYNAGRRNSFKLSPKAKPFSGGNPKIEGKFLDNGGEYYATRYFEGTAPKLSVTKGGVITKTDNIPLDFLGGLSRDTYEGIYSLDIDQIVRLKDSWEREQDSILAGLQTDLLLPNDKIMENIDNRIKSIWKGRSVTKLTKAKEIEDKIAEYKGLMQQAKQDQNQLRGIEQEEEITKEKIEACKESIANLVKEEIETKRRLDFYKEYLEIKNINDRNSVAYNYEHLPKDIKEHLKSLEKQEAEEKEKCEKVDADIIKLQEVVGKHKSLDKVIEKFKELVPKAESIASGFDGLKARTERDADKERDKKGKIMTKVKRLFNNFRWENFTDIMRIDIADCFAIWDGITKVNSQKAEVSQKALEHRKENNNFFKNLLNKMETLDIILVIAAVVGALMIVMPLGINKAVKVILGLILLLGSGAVLYFRKSGLGQEEDEFTAELKKIDGELQRLTSKLQDKFNFNFIPDEKRNNVDSSLIEAIAQLQDDYNEYTMLKNDVDTDLQRSSEKEDDIKTISTELLGRSFGYKADIVEMRTKLDEYNKLESDAESAARQIDILNTRVLELKNSIAVKDKEAEEIKEALYDIEGSSIMEKAQKLNNMRSELISAESRFKVQKKKYVDYEELEKEKGRSLETKIFELSENLEKITQKLNEDRDQEKELNEKKGQLSENKKHLSEDGLTPAVIEGKLNELYDERKQRIKERDEYLVAYGIIQKARDKYISERSPEFLKTASHYLSQITDGRYNRVALNEKGTSIMVKNNQSMAFDFEAIDDTMSRGTKEQVYFALRLAMLERFDPEGDKLPIVLDEALVNWDVERFSKLMHIIGSVARQRQVFLFTCHDYIIDIMGNINDNFRVINI